MPKHNQIEITINDDYTIEVDEGLEEIIENFYHWNIPTRSSCIDNDGSIWLAFFDFKDWETFLQLALKNSIENADNSKNSHTLWSFLQEYGKVTLTFDEACVFDPDNENGFSETGIVDISVSLRLPKVLLNDFKELFFEVMPKNNKTALGQIYG